MICWNPYPHLALTDHNLMKYEIRDKKAYGIMCDLLFGVQIGSHFTSWPKLSPLVNLEQRKIDEKEMSRKKK